MKEVSVTFMKRVTKGQYQHEEMSVGFTTSPEALESETISYKKFVYRHLGADEGMSSPIPEETTQTKGKDHGSEEKSRKSKSTGEEKSSQKEEVVLETTPPKEDKVKKPKAPKEDKKKSAGEIVYDSDNSDHKSTLSNHLTKITGSKAWAEDKAHSKKVAKEELHGQPFMAKDGSILESFTAICKKHFGAEDVL